MYSKYALPGKLFCLASVRKTLALPENVEGGTVQLTYTQITREGGQEFCTMCLNGEKGHMSKWCLVSWLGSSLSILHTNLRRSEVLCKQIIVGNTAETRPVGAVKVHAVDGDVGGDGFGSEGG